MYTGVAATTVGTSVLGASVASGALARTGMLTAAWTIMALAMIILGMGMIRSSRQRRGMPVLVSRVVGHSAGGRRRWAE